jgi:periplasmic divalent cation tolerance protein
MHPISSMYVWDGKVEEDSEIAMFVKTTSDKFDEIRDMVRSIHSYDLPCVISWDVPIFTLLYEYHLIHKANNNAKVLYQNINTQR